MTIELRKFVKEISQKGTKMLSPPKEKENTRLAIQRATYKGDAHVSKNELTHL